MTEITLIRHGQAQSGAKDEKSYDQLSDLGYQQAAWLGDYVRQSRGYDRIISGTMNRQIQTAQSLALENTPHDRDERLNELDYFGLAKSLQDSHGVDIPQDFQSFSQHLAQLLDAWHKGQMHPDLETYVAFRSRIIEALNDATKENNRVLLVTSTGVISTIIAVALDLNMAKKSKMFLNVAHTSVHKFEIRKDEVFLTQFGATPHLDSNERAHAKTFV